MYRSKTIFFSKKLLLKNIYLSKQYAFIYAIIHNILFHIAIYILEGCFQKQLIKY